ncbi:MAG: hypothetical protein R3C56_01855 [Pirellulaceae bacterium]
MVLMTLLRNKIGKFYDEAVRDAGICKQAQNTPPTMEEKLSRYASYFDVLHQARRELQAGSNLNWGNAQELRWREKIALRLRLLNIFRALDARNGQPTADGAD